MCKLWDVISEVVARTARLLPVEAVIVRAFGQQVVFVYFVVEDVLAVRLVGRGTEASFDPLVGR